MFALIDCNSFFCSVEKVFHPGLEGRPVCVLSSNDGCIVALTPEAKAVGLRRGDPIFKVQDIVNRAGVKVFSSNMMLYAAMSRRVTGILRREVQHVEKYSIDESFCCLNGYGSGEELVRFMRGVADRIRLWTDIPVSVGIAPSKTLAKIGSKFAKQYAGYHGVCLIDSELKRRKALAIFDLADVWGIGRSTLAELQRLGVNTPLAFADRPGHWVRAHFRKPGVQTWMELNGTPCIDTAEITRCQRICTSRSFGTMTGSLPELRASIATFAGSCANKLRGQDSCCGYVSVFIDSNRFRTDLPQYGNLAGEPFVTPTADTPEIIGGAVRALERIYRPGILYKRAGVILSDITPAAQRQYDLFDPVRQRPEREALMHIIDHLNQRYGLKTVQPASEGGDQQPWMVRCMHRSPDYLTDLNGILTVRD